jgi:hypothetical protein
MIQPATYSLNFEVCGAESLNVIDSAKRLEYQLTYFIDGNFGI